MADRVPEFEFADKKGTTDVFSGTVGMAWTAIPASPGSDIQSFIVHNPDESIIQETLSISLDGGSTTVDVIYPTGFSYHLIKGSIKQIWLYGSAASVNYRIEMNREPV